MQKTRRKIRPEQGRSQDISPWVGMGNHGGTKGVVGLQNDLIKLRFYWWGSEAWQWDHKHTTAPERHNNSFRRKKAPAINRNKSK